MKAARRPPSAFLNQVLTALQLQSLVVLETPPLGIDQLQGLVIYTQEVVNLAFTVRRQLVDRSIRLDRRTTEHFPVPRVLFSGRLLRMLAITGTQIEGSLLRRCLLFAPQINRQIDSRTVATWQSALIYRIDIIHGHVSTI